MTRILIGHCCGFGSRITYRVYPFLGCKLVARSRIRQTVAVPHGRSACFLTLRDSRHVSPGVRLVVSMTSTYPKTWSARSQTSLLSGTAEVSVTTIIIVIVTNTANGSMKVLPFGGPNLRATFPARRYPAMIMTSREIFLLVSNSFQAFRYPADARET